MPRKLFGRQDFRCPTGHACADSYPELTPRLTADPHTATLALGNTLQLARSFKLSSYDASHLELVMREGVPLVTLDGDLRSAMLQTGVVLVS
jgi:predicted nucleic acid-binding protein